MNKVYPALLGLTLVLSGCAPTVKVETPDKPITINLNVKIEHEVLVKLDKQIDTLLNEHSDLF
ncbi:YnbE family lipoprotein [Balneatrix alpica]|uniref:YnbE family lipoprotein n=1 Tax=Balneatrix alpica TaxID=75684 RepID=A0ABV5ZAC9_9GAMM|nr:YnbE family lipoprotein [Balneatrix alpica]